MSDSLTGWIGRPVLVVLSADAEDENYRAMIDRIYHHWSLLEEYGVVVITVAGMRVAINGESTTALTPSEVRRMLELQSYGFAMVLLGDDGSERTRRFDPAELQELMETL